MENNEKETEQKESPIITKLRDYMMGHNGASGADNREVDVANKVDASSDTAKNYADGGLILPPAPIGPSSFDVDNGSSATAGMPPSPSPAMSDPNMMASMNANVQVPAISPNPQPSAPPPDLGQVLKSVNQAPPTDYSFYKNMSAEDRMNLYKKLSEQQSSGANLTAQGAAGLGDAIARSFGGQNTDYQQNTMATAQKAKEGALNAVDTERTQKLQDMQADVESQTNDPGSPVSKSFRDAVFSMTGTKLPSGLSAAVGQKILGSAGELAMKQAVLAQTGTFRQEEEEAKKTGLRLGAAEGLGKLGILGQILHPDVVKQLSGIMAGQNSPRANAMAMKTPSGHSYTVSGQ